MDVSNSEEHQMISDLADSLRSLNAKPKVEAVVTDVITRAPRFTDFWIGQNVKYSDEYKGSRKLGKGTILDISLEGYAVVSFSNSKDGDKLRCGWQGLDDGACDIKPNGPLKDVVLSLDNRLFHVALPPNMMLGRGDSVSVDMQTSQILAKVQRTSTGRTGTVIKLLDGQAEISLANDKAIVNCSLDVEEGDQVIIDSLGTVILKVLGKAQKSFTLVKDLGIRWSDIGGQEEAKTILYDSIIGPMVEPDLYAKFGIRPIKGILMYGPPGCGKTLLGKAVASELASMSGTIPGESNFIYVKGPEILVKWVGDSEANIRNFFAQGRRQYEKTGTRQVIFFDEGDSVFYRRGSGRSSDVERTIVGTFLAEMDGMEENHSLIIIATNKPDSLDEAVTRPGRIDRSVRVGRPNIESAPELFKLYLDRAPLADDVSSDGLSQVGSGSLFNNGRVLCNVSMKNTDDAFRFTLGHIASGALIENIVEMAKAHALTRAKAGGTLGITIADLKKAIDQTHDSNKGLDHTDALHDFLGPRSSEIARVERISAVA